MDFMKIKNQDEKFIKLGIYISKSLEVSYYRRGKLYTLDLEKIENYYELKLKLNKTRKIFEKRFKIYKFKSYLLMERNFFYDEYQIKKNVIASGIAVESIVYSDEILKDETLSFSEWGCLRLETENILNGGE